MIDPAALLVQRFKQLQGLFDISVTILDSNDLPIAEVLGENPLRWLIMASLTDAGVGSTLAWVPLVKGEEGTQMLVDQFPFIKYDDFPVLISNAWGMSGSPFGDNDIRITEITIRF